MALRHFDGGLETNNSPATNPLRVPNYEGTGVTFPNACVVQEEIVLNEKKEFIWGSPDWRAVFASKHTFGVFACGKHNNFLRFCPRLHFTMRLVILDSPGLVAHWQVAGVSGGPS